MRGCTSAKTITVIEVKAVKGTGVERDPVRETTGYWTLDGKLLVEFDGWVDSNTGQSSEKKSE